MSWQQIGWLLCSVVLLQGCQRNCNDVWQDTKTCGRHMHRGLQCLGGKHEESREICYAEAFTGPPELDYIPLVEEDLYNRVEVDSLPGAEYEEECIHPQAAFAPGDPGSPVPSLSAFEEPIDGELAQIFQRLHFETDQYAIRGMENLTILTEIIDYLHRHPDLYLFIEGHCDERGPAAYNLALGARRSNAVRNYLIEKGVDLNRLFSVSYGKERPLMAAHTRDAWKENRRAQFRIYHKGLAAK